VEGEAVEPTDTEGQAPRDSGAPPVVNVDGEVALIVLRASGGTCRFTYGAPGMTGGLFAAAAVASGLQMN
jgi:hypothetical protein